MPDRFKLHIAEEFKAVLVLDDRNLMVHRISITRGVNRAKEDAAAFISGYYAGARAACARVEAAHDNLEAFIKEPIA